MTWWPGSSRTWPGHLVRGAGLRAGAMANIGAPLHDLANDISMVRRPFTKTPHSWTVTMPRVDLPDRRTVASTRDAKPAAHCAVAAPRRRDATTWPSRWRYVCERPQVGRPFEGRARLRASEGPHRAGHPDDRPRLRQGDHDGKHVLQHAPIAVASRPRRARLTPPPARNPPLNPKMPRSRQHKIDSRDDHRQPDGLSEVALCTRSWNCVTGHPSPDVTAADRRAYRLSRHSNRTCA
jgi:hypothetical protein